MIGLSLYLLWRFRAQSDQLSLQLFVEGVITTTTLITKLTQLYVPFVLCEEHEAIFQSLAKLHTTTLILTLLVDGKHFIVYCDTYGVELGVY